MKRCFPPDPPPTKHLLTSPSLSMGSEYQFDKGCSLCWGRRSRLQARIGPLWVVCWTECRVESLSVAHQCPIVGNLVAVGHLEAPSPREQHQIRPCATPTRIHIRIRIQVCQVMEVPRVSRTTILFWNPGFALVLLPSSRELKLF